MTHRFKLLCISISVLATIGIASCASNEDGPSTPNGNNTLKLKSLNLNKVKALAIANTTDNSRAGELVNPGLLKIDDDGNVSTIGIVSEIVNEETGETSTSQRTITVKPRKITDLGLYTLLWDCSFIDAEDGTQYSMKQFYEPNSTSWDFHLMVRKKDGKILYVPTSDTPNEYHLSEIISDIETYTSYTLPQISPDEEVYIVTFLGTLYKLEEAGDNINVRAITDGIVAGMGGITFANDGSLMINSHNQGYNRYDGCTIIKANGEIFRHQTTNDDEIIGYSCTAGKYLATKTISKYNDHRGVDLEFSIHKVNEDFSLGDEIFHVNTDFCPDYGLQDWTLGWYLRGNAPRIYESDKYYIVSNFLVINKETGEYKAYEGTDWDNNFIVFPSEDKSNFYDGLVWSLGYDAAWHFNPNTLECGKVTYVRKYADGPNEQGGYRNWPMINNFKQGEVTYYREENGKTIFYRVDFTTGNETVTETEYVMETIVPVK